MDSIEQVIAQVNTIPGLDFGQILATYGLPTAVAGLLGFILYRELKDRINKSEAREDKMIAAFDKLADAAEAQNEITKSLMETKGRRGTS